MDIIVCVALFLLVSSVSTSQTGGDEEILARQRSLQQSCLHDIHGVLREMTASLTEMKLKITLLEKENQELKQQKIEIDQLKQKQQDLKTELNTVKEQRQVEQVAFSASLLTEGEVTLGPYKIKTTLIFKRVLTNAGNAYSPHTGIFTAPVKGAYHFDWSVLGGGDIAAAAVLMKNSEHIFLAYERQTGHNPSTSRGTSLVLEAGDQVSVRLWTDAKIYDNQNHYNTFSGHLIFPI
ncbi:complement C1q-like protein 4 [Pholidichthys leucotaenia]